MNHLYRLDRARHRRPRGVWIDANDMLYGAEVRPKRLWRYEKR